MKSSIKSTPFIIPAPLGKGCRCEAMTPPWKFPRPKWEAPVGVQAFANHLHLAIFESTPEVRVLSSTGITRLQRSYDPVRLPPVPPPEATLRPLPSHQTGLPRLPEPPFRRAVPTTPADRAGALVDCFPAHAAFPKWQEGRHPHCHFRGLLRLHSRYGPPDRSAAQRRPLSRGSDPCGYPHKPLVSYRINRQLSGWNFLLD